jgi:hypothetical protein
MSAIPESGKFVARSAAAAFGGTARVDRYYDEDESHSVDLLTCVDRPMPGFTTYSTVSLHTVPNMLDDSDVRIEMAGVAANQVAEFPNMLASAAFRVVIDGWLCAPGVVFPSLVTEQRLSSSLEHVLWVPPFPWEQLGSVDPDGGPIVHWLLAVPISEAERRFLVDRGYEHLEALMADRETEYFDLGRSSIL